MPELPEIHVIAKQMDKVLSDKEIDSVSDKQPKHLNMPLSEFAKRAKGKRVKHVVSRGKWLFVELEGSDYLLINLGMGAEILYFGSAGEIPENAQFKLTFSDKTGFSIHFWWFGYVHLVSEKSLSEHSLTSNLGISPIDYEFTYERLKQMLAGKKSGIKSFLLDQKNLCGIGNVYVQDILFNAKLHPNRKINTLDEQEMQNLYKSIRQVLTTSINLGGAAFELNFYGKKGGFTSDNFLVGYRTGRPCPVCRTNIEKIKTGSTASYICPKCQPAK